MTELSTRSWALIENGGSQVVPKEEVEYKEVQKKYEIRLCLLCCEGCKLNKLTVRERRLDGITGAQPWKVAKPRVRVRVP